MPDWTVVIDDLAGTLKAGLDNALGNGDDPDVDYEAFAKDIAGDMVMALQDPDADKAAVLYELKAQTRLLAEAKRIQTTNAGWDTFEAVMETTFRVAGGLIAKVLL